MLRCALALTAVAAFAPVAPNSARALRSHRSATVKTARVTGHRGRPRRAVLDPVNDEPPAEGSVAPVEEVEISQFDELLIGWGVKPDPRIPEDCRLSPMEKIKASGKAGIAAYTVTEFGFWLTSVPLAIAAVAFTTGSLPDLSTLEGKEEVGGYAFVFINFARAIVPLRIAFALALAPWCDKNIIQKYFPAKEKTEAEQAKEEDCEVLP